MHSKARHCSRAYVGKSLPTSAPLWMYCENSLSSASTCAAWCRRLTSIPCWCWMRGSAPRRWIVWSYLPKRAYSSRRVEKPIRVGDARASHSQLYPSRRKEATVSIKIRATIDDLYKVEGKAELVHGEIVHMAPTGDDPGMAVRYSQNVSF